MSAPSKDIQSFYYITHKSNVPGILAHGILSHQEMGKKRLQHKKIYDKEIVTKRENVMTLGDKPLWHYANLYFNPRNPMLYRVAEISDPNSQARADIVILQIRRDVMDIEGAHIAVGNATSPHSHICPVAEGVSEILDKSVWKKINAKYWNHHDDGKRIIMSELLVPDRVPPSYIEAIYVSCRKTKNDMSSLTSKQVMIEGNKFFLPNFTKEIGQNISLVNGDMFFSSMQTFTVSVNTQGIMGKGLASRAKHQFPDVYVKYQGACRHKTLTEQRPWLYKRESLMDIELADMPEYLRNPNASRWFLLFATKRHWRDNSRIEDVDAGLRWLEHNYEHEGIKSIALPALGCGLGGLSWAEVGPLMCKTLSQLNIHSAIYLPHEIDVPKEQMEENFLLGN